MNGFSAENFPNSITKSALFPFGPSSSQGSVAAMAITMPLDNVRTRMLLAKPPEDRGQLTAGTLDVFLAIVKKEGL